MLFAIARTIAKIILERINEHFENLIGCILSTIIVLFVIGDVPHAALSGKGRTF